MVALAHPALNSTPRALKLEAQIGNTPLLGFTRITAHLPADVHVFAKAEWANPGGSVKDRAALRIVRTALDAGLLTSDKILLDSTSGNTGIAYAMLGAAMGFAVRLYLPGNASPERIAILRAYGADLVLTDPLEGSDGAIRAARAELAAHPDRYYYADQYNNPANWQAHFYGTAPEIHQQTAGKITHFVAGLGTSGTLMGTGRGLKALDPDIQVIALHPDSPFHGVEGWKHMPTAIVPGIYDGDFADGNRAVTTEDSYEMARKLAREEGYLVGVSAAAALAGALAVAEDLAAQGQPGVVVTIFPDNAYKYLSEGFWTA